MSKIGRFFVLAAGIALLCGQGGGAERRSLAPGSGAFPLVRADGGLTLAYRNQDGGLGFQTNPGTDDAQARKTALSAGSLVRGPIAKRAPDGTTGIVWMESGKGGGSLRYGRLVGESLVPGLVLPLGEIPASSPDLDFAPDNGAWIAWIRQSGGRDEVRVAESATGRVWTVNGPYNASALEPRILATPAQGVWVFWTGRDRGRDEIFAAVLRTGSWSEPMRLSRGDAVPHWGASPALDADGFPWAAWSEYDGRAYAIQAAFWDGAAWSAPERLTAGRGSDASPAAAVTGSGALIAVWSRAAEGATSIVARYRRGAEWSPEIPLTAEAGKRARSPRLSAAGEMLGLVWDEGDVSRTLVLSMAELAAGSAAPVLPMAPPPVLNSARDENQYTCFGDSITFAEYHGYQPILEPRLVQRYGRATLWNEGIGGETTVEALDRFDETLAAHASRFLLLLEGTNDVIFGSISMDTSAFALDEMVRRSLAAGVLPLISTILPRKDWYWDVPVFQNRIFELNNKIRTLAATRKVPLVDQFNVFYYYPVADGGWRGLMLDDGVHPNPKGFGVMAGGWFNGIIILPFAPVRLRLSREKDKVLFGERVYEVLRWQNSPKCDPNQIAGFRIYRKERAQAVAAFELKTVFPFLPLASDYRFRDAPIALGKAYAYVITALRKDGVEGPASEVIFDVP